MFSAVVCHGFSTAQWFDVTPYSSKRHGFPAALQAAPCEVTQRLPQSLLVPPVLLAGDLELAGSVEDIQLSGYKWKVPKSIVSMVNAFAKSEPSEYPNG